MQTENIIFSQTPVSYLVNAIADEVLSRLLPLYPTAPVQATNKKSEKLLTRKETAATLRISLPTLDKWSTEGRLTAYRIARQVRYKEAEVLASIAKMQTVAA